MIRRLRFFLQLLPMSLMAIDAMPAEGPAYACTRSLGGAAASGEEGGSASDEAAPERLTSLCGNSDPSVRYEPVYPQAALDAKVSGNVELSLTVMPDGSVTKVQVVSVHPAGYGFEDAAQEAVSLWRYNPSSFPNGSLPRPDLRVTIKFRLE